MWWGLLCGSYKAIVSASDTHWCTHTQHQTLNRNKPSRNKPLPVCYLDQFTYCIHLCSVTLAERKWFSGEQGTYFLCACENVEILFSMVVNWNRVIFAYSQKVMCVNNIWNQSPCYLYEYISTCILFLYAESFHQFKVKPSSVSVPCHKLRDTLYYANHGWVQKKKQVSCFQIWIWKKKKQQLCFSVLVSV